MKKTTLVFCVRDKEVLLAMKKRGFGAGKWNGYGGKIDGDETPVMAAVRELKEESALVTQESCLEQVALINFSFDGVPVFECYVYLTHLWENEPIETDEMRPMWYPISDLPFEAMWVADLKWIPLVLQGEKIEAQVNFNADGTEVIEFRCMPMKCR